MGTPITGTFMFTDLVGSTALGSRLGPAAAEELRQTHFGILRGAAAATGGIEVKSTGDGVMLLFTGPSRALSCAAAIQQGIDRHNRRATEPLSVRIGVSAGEAVEDDGDYYGDCVVEAARLCDRAEGGQILTTELVRALVGRNTTQGFNPVGDLDLKGLSDPVPTLEVIWEPEAVPGAVPLPPRLVGAATEGLFGFFGRVEEVDALLTAASRATEETRTEVVLVSGEPGIGKTTLAAQTARALHADGATVLFGHCAEGLAVPYQPWIEALNHFVEHAPEDLLRAHVEAYGPVLARAVPALCRRVPEATPGDVTGMADGERYALLEAIRGLLTSAAGDGCVLILDDVQWADTASLHLLRHLLVGGTPPPVLVIVTYRDTDLTRDHPLTPFLADLHREPWITRLTLRGLSDKELLALMEGAAGYEMDADGLALARALYRETDGNPFFTGEMLRHLFETGAIALDHSGRYVLTIDLDQAPLPGSVRDVVMRRVDRLGDDVNRILTLASVIGRQFDLAVLTAIADDDEDTLLDHLETATNAALVTEVGELPGCFRFEHALIQHSLYQDLGATRRQRLHHRIAETLEDIVGANIAGNAELAHHWLAATQPTDAHKAVEYARLAGEDALAALAPDDAIRWFTQALELHDRLYPDDQATRCDLLTGLGTAQRLSGLPEHHDTLFEAGDLARAVDDPDRLVRVALAWALETLAFEIEPRRVALIEYAIARVPPETATAARLYMALACSTDPREGATLTARAERAIEIAGAADDEGALLQVMLAWASVCARPDTLEQRIAAMERAAAMAERQGDHLGRFLASYQASISLMEAARVVEADAEFERTAELASGLHYLYADWMVLVDRSARVASTGDFALAEQLADEALGLGTRAGFPAALGAYGGMLHDIRVAQGRADEILDFFVEAADAMPMIEPLRLAAIRILAESGDLEKARERFALERAAGFVYSPVIGWYNSVEAAADACVELGDQASAPTLLALARPCGDRLLASHAVASRPLARSVGRLAGLLRLDDEAEAAFAKSLELCDLLGAPYWKARTLVDRAEWLSRRSAPGDAERIDADLEAALALAEPIGAGHIAQRVARVTRS